MQSTQQKIANGRFQNEQSARQNSSFGVLALSRHKSWETVALTEELVTQPRDDKVVEPTNLVVFIVLT